MPTIDIQIEHNHKSKVLNKSLLFQSENVTQATSFLRLLFISCVLQFLVFIFPVNTHAQTIADKNSPIQVKINKPDELYKGYLLWHQSDEPREDYENITLLSDAYGKVVNTWGTNLTSLGIPAYLLENGILLRSGISNPETFSGGSIASSNTIQMVDKDGKIIWEYKTPDPERIYFHHDFEPMPNGNILLSVYHVVYAKEASNMGWDMGDQSQIWTEEIFEIKPDIEKGTGEIVWRWSITDHLIQDDNPDILNFGAVSEHPERIDPNYPKSYAPRKEMRQHVNSIDYNPELDQIMLSCFMYNEIWIIDHSTSTSEAAGSKGGKRGKGGDLLYRYGNPEAYGMGTPTDRIFLKQHDANWIESGLKGAGNILLHNNNLLIGGKPEESKNRKSQIYEIEFPVKKDETYKKAKGKSYKAEIVWKWEHPDYFAAFQGGARRLPNGNTLITNARAKHVMQLNAKGEIVAEYKGSAPIYKGFMYSPDYVKNIIE